MKLYSWNVNGIRAVWNKGLFQEFIASHDPDVLCLQETKVDADWVALNQGFISGDGSQPFLRQAVAKATARNKKLANASDNEELVATSASANLTAQPNQSPVDLPQYKEYWHSAEKKGYSGTAIFSKTEPKEIRNGFSETIQNRYNFPDKFGDPTKEGRVLSAKFDDFWVVTVYTPNSKDKLERLELRHKVWDPAFLDHVRELELEAPVVFCGDFNVAHKEIDLARPKENVGKHGFTFEEREGFDKMLSAGYVDTFRLKYPDRTEAYTWWTAWGGARERNVGWRIDYWMASQQLADQIVSAEIHPGVMGSDHCPVSIEIRF